jgi:hypothetical protein
VLLNGAAQIEETALPCPQFALLPSVTCVQLKLITILGKLPLRVSLVCPRPYRLSQPQGHSAAGRIRIRSTEKSNDLIGIRTRDLPACSIVPQPGTACPLQKDIIIKLVSGRDES